MSNRDHFLPIFAFFIQFCTGSNETITSIRKSLSPRCNAGGILAMVWPALDLSEPARDIDHQAGVSLPSPVSGTKTKLFLIFSQTPLQATNQSTESLDLENCMQLGLCWIPET